ncbi:TPA: sensor histidine kinase [Streptococcus suis]
MIRKFLREYRSWYVSYGCLLGGIIFLFYLYQLPTAFLIQTLILGATLLVLLSLYQYTDFKNRIQSFSDLDVDRLLADKPLDQAFMAAYLEQKQVLQDQSLALKTKEETLQALVKLWAHQMKVPLAALSLMSQMDQLDPHQIEVQLSRLDHYMANLLNYMKLSNQSSDFRFEEVEAKDLVLDLVAKYRQQFLLKNLALKIEGDWTVTTDRKWLSFALAQIIDNAIKYNVQGGQVIIRLSDGIIIEDRGMGILAEDLPRLFDEGFTGYNGRQHQKASGFGLYLTKQVLDQLGLNIQVESQVDVGTKVTIASSDE